MSWMRVLLAACLAANLAACSSPGHPLPGTPDHAKAAIVATLERLIVADNACDLETVLSCYTEDVIWLPPGEPPVSGKTAIAARYGKLFGSSRLELDIEVADAFADGTVGSAWGFTRGSITPVAGGDRTEVNDKFLAVLRWDGSAWRVAQLAWSPQAHAP
ncbi:MAG TPA: nuclear transport factor 2 family protein [Planctomycetota bacterium]|nr:nuclear transport factor 2 family protein [Planctomycetota bacterium]